MIFLAFLFTYGLWLRVCTCVPPSLSLLVNEFQTAYSRLPVNYHAVPPCRTPVNTRRYLPIFALTDYRFSYGAVYVLCR